MAQQNLPLVVDTNTLAERLGSPGLRIVFVGDRALYEQAHIPGATQIEYAALNAGGPPAMGQLPSPTSLARLLGQAGITPETHVVGCDAEGNGRASRLLWTLDCIGHHNWSLLDGGVIAWQADGLRFEHGPGPDAAVADYPVDVNASSARADLAHVQSHLGDPDVAILDARSPGEYQGDDVRAARGGHIPGAVNLEWTENIDVDNAARLRPKETLKAMYEALGLSPGQEVITHCQTHHRSALSYVVLRYLGYDRARGYDGSWSEWGNRTDTPVVTGDAPE